MAYNNPNFHTGITHVVIRLFSRPSCVHVAEHMGSIFSAKSIHIFIKCIASSNKCLTSSNKKLLGTSASLLVTMPLCFSVHLMWHGPHRSIDRWK